MFENFKWAIVLASFTLAGCVNPPIRYAEANPTKNERITNVTVVFQRGPLPITYTQYQHRNPDETRAGVTRDVNGIVDAVERQGSQKLVTALGSRGIYGSGGDTKIVLRPISAYVRIGANIELEVTVQAQGKPKWVVIIRGGQVIGWQGATADSNAQEFTDKIIAELVKAGFIAP